MERTKAMNRREVLKAMAKLSAAPLAISLGTYRALAQLAHHGSLTGPEQAGEEWVPQFLTPQQDETVTVISDLIIPETETPGARGARVNEFIDFALSRDTPKAQQAFLQGLEWIDRRSGELFSSDFVELSVERQIDLLTRISFEEEAAPDDRPGVAFFKDIKDRTIVGYYSSEIGLRQELGFQGLSVLLEFPGCRHPEHLNWEP